MKIKAKESLRNRTWWKVGGAADYFCSPGSEEELKEALLWAEGRSIPVTALGSGTNVLVSDKGVDGLVISMEKMTAIQSTVEGNVLNIKAEAGVLKSRLMAVFRQHNLAPALFLSGLPGDVGGGVVMNAGISKDIEPKEFSEIVKDFEVMTEKGTNVFKNQDIKWGYRTTKGWGEGLIYRVHFEWPLKPIKDLNQKIKILLKGRRDSQPLSEASCGSVFRNPYPQYAGKLIEDSGLKGLKRGDAFVSEKHGNFIINKGKASSQDIDHLIRTIQEIVQKKFGVLLEKEVHYLGRWNDTDPV